MSAAEKKDKSEGAAPKAPLNVALIVGLVNAVVAFAGIGALVYTKILYKRPVITEASERERLAKLKAKPKAPEVPGKIAFERLTVNILGTPKNIKPADHTERQIEGKLHFVTLAFTLEIRDENRKGEIEAIRPLLMDKLLAALGRKSFQELSTVQGRYILKTQMMEFINQLLTRRSATPIHDGLVTNVFFTEFLVQ